jgi:hypothetical protein
MSIARTGFVPEQLRLDALEGFTRQMKKMPALLRESLTYDRRNRNNLVMPSCPSD